jgi:SpoVK/Ycf46/Vps4 family AAA+-type ATPase
MRKEMVLRHLHGVNYQLSEKEMTTLIEKLDGYSGRDIRNIVVDACNRPTAEVTTSELLQIR